MRFFFNWDKKKKRKSKNNGCIEDDNVKKSENRKGSGDIGSQIDVHRPMERNNLSISNMETTADVPLADIIKLSSGFCDLMQDCTDFETKKRLVTTLKSLAKKMTQRNFTEEDIDATLKDFELVQQLVKEPPQVRARLGLAVVRFCTVVEVEMENEELTRDTGFLEGLRGGNELAAHAVAPVLGHGGSSALLKTIPPVENIDVDNIFHRLTTMNELPSLGEMAELIRRTTKLLKQESNIVMVPLPCIFVGDIHGQWKDLVNVIAAGGPLNVGNETRGEDSKDAVVDDDIEVVGKRNYLFLGDYVDRGPQSLHCLGLLFAAKLLAPHHVFLLRGNHESGETNSKYGFLKECCEHYPLPAEGSEGDEDSTDMEWNLPAHPLWVLANEAFLSLPLCAIVTDHGVSRNASEDSVHDKTSNKNGNTDRGGSSKKENIAICAMHGGLSPFISDSLDGILAINRFREIDDGPLADITWADPVTSDPGSNIYKGENNKDKNKTKTRNKSTAIEGKATGGLVRHAIDFNYDAPIPKASEATGYAFSIRGRGHNFGEDVTMRFLQENKLSFIVRAHQCVHEGFQWQHQRRIMTVFSAPNYCGLGNKAAILILHASGEPEVVQFEAVVSGGGDNTPPVALPAPVPPKAFAADSS